MSESTSLDLNTNLASADASSGVVYNELNGGSIANAEFVSPVPPGSPIPIKAPRQVASASQAANAVAQQPVQDGQSQTLVTSLADPAQNQDATSASAQLANATNGQAVTEVPANATTVAQTVSTEQDATNAAKITAEQVQPEVSQVAALDPGLEQEAPKSNFSKRWSKSASKKSTFNYYKNRNDRDSGFNSTRSKRKKIKKPKVASLASSNTISSDETTGLTNTTKKRRKSSKEMTALPGVKTNNEIFGIEEHEDVAETKVAALGGLGRISPNGLRVQHSKVQVACLKQGVLQILKKVEKRYGKKPIITSGYRSPKRNRRAGGARNSQHIYCKAVDIQVEGISKWNLAKYLRSIPGRGGVGTYCRTRSVHIDIGSKRDWHSKCRRSSVKKRKKRKKS